MATLIHKNSPSFPAAAPGAQSVSLMLLQSLAVPFRAASMEKFS